MTNSEVLAVSNSSSNNRQVWRTDSQAVWVGTSTGGGVYAALFQLTGTGSVSATLDQLGLKTASAHVRDLWTHKDLGLVKDQVAAHLTACSKSSTGPCCALYMLQPVRQ